MAPNSNRPAWVIKDLSSILGLDDESIQEMVVPDLESYTNETRLRVHLHDFLGSSPSAKSFITRYSGLRFPSLSSAPTPSHTPPTSDWLKTDSMKPNGHSSATPSRSASTAPPQSRLEEGLQSAFGPGGKIYQKNREADESSFLQVGRSTSSNGGSRSGSQTPASSNQARVRQAGAVNFQVQVQSQQRVDTQSQSRGNSSKGKSRAGGEKIWDREKSKEVKRLEGIVDRLKVVREGEGKIKDEGGVKCFCQARVHSLSSYTPICQSCGLTICSLHAPYLSCPSCAHALYTPAQLARLILRMEEEVEAQLLLEDKAREQAERERLERLAAEAGGGAFPTLPGGAHTSVSQGGVGGTRKVLTINSAAGAKAKGKAKATITTTTYRPTPPASAGGSRAPTPPPNDIISRPRSSPVDMGKIEKELSRLLAWRDEDDRPWGDLKAEKKGNPLAWTYKDLEVVVLQTERHVGRRKAAKVRRGMDGREVPGA